MDNDSQRGFVGPKDKSEPADNFGTSGGSFGTSKGSANGNRTIKTNETIEDMTGDPGYNTDGELEHKPYNNKSAGELH